MKATRDDLTLIHKLTDKLGVGTSQIIRIALRSLARAHKVTLKSA